MLNSYRMPLDEGVGVFNGDMGIVREINSYTERITVEFEEGRRVEYEFKQAEELELAYAVTIHKSQGSEYPAVILPLPIRQGADAHQVQYPALFQLP